MCDWLGTITNGNITYSNGHGENQYASYACSSGYALRGNSRRYCTLQSHWNGSTPSCIAVGMNNIFEKCLFLQFNILIL